MRAGLKLCPNFRGKSISRRALFCTIPSTEDVLLRRGQDGFATVNLNRENVHNTLNDKVIGEFSKVFEEVEADKSIRGVFLEASGRFFSAGADLNWMKKAGTLSEEENTADALALSAMLAQLDSLSKPTVALVQGPCFGGGVGLVACCDIAIGVPKATFTLSEVKLGIIPATISPFVVAKIGSNYSRRYFLTAETFDAREAWRMGLLHEVCTDEKGLAEWKADLRRQLTLCAPTAVASAKELIRAVDGGGALKGGRMHEEKSKGRTGNWDGGGEAGGGESKVSQAVRGASVMADTARRLAVQRRSAEGQAGLEAFLSREPAPWARWGA